MEHVLRSALLSVKALQDLGSFMKKLKTLERSCDLLTTLLNQYAQHNVSL